MTGRGIQEPSPSSLSQQKSFLLRRPQTFELTGRRRWDIEKVRRLQSFRAAMIRLLLRIAVVVLIVVVVVVLVVLYAVLKDGCGIVGSRNMKSVEM